MAASVRDDRLFEALFEINGPTARENALITASLALMAWVAATTSGRTAG
jgi:hypothetical protein